MWAPNPGASAFTYNTTNFTNTKVRKIGAPTFDDLAYLSPEQPIKNTCCLGPICVPLGSSRWGFERVRVVASALRSRSGTLTAMRTPDAVVSTYFYNGYGGTIFTGSIFVVFGGPGNTLQNLSPLLLSTCNGTNCIRIDGVTVGGRAGEGTAVGDINHDGYDDIVIGNSTKPLLCWPARSVLAGKGWQLHAQRDHEYRTDRRHPRFRDRRQRGHRKLWGRQQQLSLAVGDINGDGYKNIIIGASSATVNGVAKAGKVYVVYGSAFSGLPAPTVNTHTTTCG